MGVATIGRRPRWAPPAHARIDWSHPLAPVGGWGAAPSMGVDFFGQRGTLTTGVSSLNAPTGFGSGFSTSTSATGGIQWPFPPTFVKSTTALTFVVVNSVTSSAAGNGVIMVIRDNGSDAAPYLVASVYAEAGTNALGCGIRDQGGTFRPITGFGGTIAAGVGQGVGVLVNVYTLSPSTNSFKYYRNGALFGSSSWAGSVTGFSWPTTPPGIAIMGYGANTTSQGNIGSCVLGLAYPRLLSVAEITALCADPFQFLVW